MHFHTLHDPFRNRFTAHGTLAYHAFASAASALNLFPIIIGAKLLAR